MRCVFRVLFLCLLTSACKNTCEGFPEDELKWIPFEVNKNIKYSYNESTLDFTVKDVFYSKKSKFSGEPFPEACTPTAWYQTDTSDSISIYEKVEMISAYPYMTTSFSSNSVFYYELRDGYYFNSISVRYIGDTTLNGTVFNEVFEVSKDSQNEINWLIKTEDIGIISFGVKESNKIWTQIL